MMGLLRVGYSIVAYLLVPLVVGNLLWRSLKAPDYRRRIAERFGFGLPRPSASATIWLHAVSVGEVQAAFPLVQALLRHFPDHQLVMTTVTPTGADRVGSLFGGKVDHYYVPYDTPGAVRRFFQRVNPCVAVVLETELWPNLYRECGRREVPLVLASARISPRSVERYRWAKKLVADALSHGVVIAAQSQEDADRFLSLGAAPERTWVTGNIKFDIELDETQQTLGRALRQQQLASRPTWIAASTHEGEEQIVLAAHRRVVAHHPRAVLIVVPRHPERFDRVAQQIRAQGLKYARRSLYEELQADDGVYLADTLGELIGLYAAAEVAFVAGSLVPIGGHSLLEAAAVGTAMLAGPHNHNAQYIADQLVVAGGLEIVKDGEALAERVIELLGDPEHRSVLARNAAKCLNENRGAVERLLALLEPLIERAA
ncbi:MAG: lipid IV(A) 3-deoxy-D-manno-octulosonic acid transferase [Gammaproteobacteria bacterium]